MYHLQKEYVHSVKIFEISDPCAPAFIYTAPPTEPGIPLANSNPDRPFRLI